MQRGHRLLSQTCNMLMAAAHLAKCLLDPLDFLSHVGLHGLSPSHLLMGVLGESRGLREMGGGGEPQASSFPETPAPVLGSLWHTLGQQEKTQHGKDPKHLEQCFSPRFSLRISLPFPQ